MSQSYDGPDDPTGLDQADEMTIGAENDGVIEGSDSLEDGPRGSARPGIIPTDRYYGADRFGTTEEEEEEGESLDQLLAEEAPERRPLRQGASRGRGGRDRGRVPRGDRRARSPGGAAGRGGRGRAPRQRAGPGRARRRHRRGRGRSRRGRGARRERRRSRAPLQLTAAPGWLTRVPADNQGPGPDHSGSGTGSGWPADTGSATTGSSAWLAMGGSPSRARPRAVRTAAVSESMSYAP